MIWYTGYIDDNSIMQKIMEKLTVAGVNDEIKMFDYKYCKLFKTSSIKVNYKCDKKPKLFLFNKNSMIYASLTYKL